MSSSPLDKGFAEPGKGPDISGHTLTGGVSDFLGQKPGMELSHKLNATFNF